MVASKDTNLAVETAVTRVDAMAEMKVVWMVVLMGEKWAEATVEQMAAHSVDMKDVIWVVWMVVQLDAWMVGCLAGSWADSTAV